MLFSVITTISPPTPAVQELSRRHKSLECGPIIIVGDQKGPRKYELPNCKLITIADQQNLFRRFSNILPKNHYARKNIGYLYAIQNGATSIYESDDDNYPNAAWFTRSQLVQDVLTINGNGANGEWVNIYKYFSSQNIWPRGLPLARINSRPLELIDVKGVVNAPIQQGLANNSPDVDAVWRLVFDRPFEFDPEKKASILVPKNIWCPFNTQSTWWWPAAYPLMYVPSFCSFRMCDIWRSFIAQRCLWEIDAGIVFHPPEVIQERNPHNLNKDFDDEIPGYRLNDKIAKILQQTQLDGKGWEGMTSNLKTCYEALIREEIFPKEEMSLVAEWVSILESFEG